MKLFPEYKYNLKFNLTPEQYKKIMINNMNLVDQNTHNFSGKSKLFTGYFNNMYFEMIHEIEGGNSGNPKITGTVKEENNGCIVEIKFSLFSEVKAILLLMYLFISLIFIITFSLFIYQLFQSKLNLLFLISIILFIIIQVYIHFLMDGQITYTIEDIKEIIHSQKNEID